MVAGAECFVSRRILSVRILWACGVLFSRWPVEQYLGLRMRAGLQLDISSFFLCVLGLGL